MAKIPLHGTAKNRGGAPAFKGIGIHAAAGGFANLASKSDCGMSATRHPVSGLGTPASGCAMPPKVAMEAVLPNPTPVTQIHVFTA